MVKTLENVTTYIGILFLVIILGTAIVKLGNEFILNSNSNPDNDSLNYIGSLQNVNFSQYQTNKQQQEKPILGNENYTQGTPKDYAMEFLFVKDKSNDLELTIKRIFNIPSFLIVDLLRLPFNDWKWLLDIIGWLLGLTVAIALIYFLRGVLSK